MAKINQGWLSASKPKWVEENDAFFFKLGTDVINTELSSEDGMNIASLINEKIKPFNSWSVYYYGDGRWDFSSGKDFKMDNMQQEVYDLISKIHGYKFKLSPIEENKYSINFKIYSLV
jgi:hypothetical protein